MSDNFSQYTLHICLESKLCICTKHTQNDRQNMFACSRIQIYDYDFLNFFFLLVSLPSVAVKQH